MTESADSALQARLQPRGLVAGEPVVARIEIDAAPSRVWEVISPPGNLNKFHPFCEENQPGTWSGAGSWDRILYHSGICYKRRVVAWLEGSGYDLELGSETKITCQVSWRIEPRDSGSCELSISVTPYLEGGWDSRQTAAYLKRFYGPAFDHYLDSVVRGLEYYVRTGEVVARDQFGHNPVFSAPAA